MENNKADPVEKNQVNNHWPLTLIVFFIIYYLFSLQLTKTPTDIAYSEFIQKITSDEVQSVMIQGLELKGKYRTSAIAESNDGSAYDFSLVLPNFIDSQFLEMMTENDVDVVVKSDQPSVMLSLIMGFLPWILIIAFLVWSSRAIQGRMTGGQGLFSFGKSSLRRFEPTKDSPGYAQVAGLEGAKQDLQEVVDYLKNPEPYQKMGAKIPKGILMMGAPGTGKTLLAKATATEANVPFFSISGSEFIEMYVGVGASRVRDMFKQAREQAPALIFIDEIDSVGRVRGTGIGGGNDEREQTLNQVLAEMDGFDPKEMIVVLAATNRPDVLDPALLRPGRFDRKVVLEMPQREARLAILNVHIKDKPLADDVDLENVAALTVGFSGADLANLINEAALRAAREQRDEIINEDLITSREKVILGSPRKDLINPDERQRIACHEAGHAITAFFSTHSDPVQRISIVPRGQSLGLTEQIPEEDRHNLNQDYLEERLAILLGGRCAEKLIYQSVSTGASDDLKQATKLARKMVAQWGMSEKIGPMGFVVSEDHPFLGREITEPKEFSEKTAMLLDEEAQKKLLNAEQVSSEILSANKPFLKAVIKALIKYETVDRKQFEEIFYKQKNTQPETAEPETAEPEKVQ